MKHYILPVSIPGALAALLALGAAPAFGQEARPTLSGGEAPTVLAMEEADDMLRMTVGHSKLLQAGEPFGTIIVGDDTIANATVGAGNAIIVTGLTAGSTNLIVLGESQRMLMSSTIAVVPVAGPLRATVTVLRGADTRERYECRGTDCTLIDPQGQPTEMSFLLTPASEAASSGETPSGEDAAAAP